METSGLDNYKILHGSIDSVHIIAVALMELPLRQFRSGGQQWFATFI